MKEQFPWLIEPTQEEIEKRYAEKVSPDYEDHKKPSPQKYGNLVFWKQLLDFGSTVQKPIIIVIDDQKEDWWVRSKES